MKIAALFVIMITALKAYGLDLDEKLTLRLLKVSESRKTVLINRGIEDGLVVGDHAKFYLTTGMVARGVVVKVSPSRSVWSLYRLIAPQTIANQKVMNLKIATPVKITIDATKMITVEPIAVPGQDISIAPEAGIIDDSLVSSDMNELESLRTDSNQRNQNTNSSTYSYEPKIYGRTKKTWEAFLALDIGQASGQTEDGTGNTSTSSSAGMTGFSIGVEKYFPSPGKFYEKMSLFALLHKVSGETTDTANNTVDSSVTEYGIGVNYHFLASPQVLKKMIGFVGSSIGVGAATLGSNSGADLSGTSSYFTLGGGVKYNMKNFGGRVALEYYRRAESYKIEQTNGSTTEQLVTISGPRIILGLNYRF